MTTLCQLSLDPAFLASEEFLSEVKLMVCSDSYLLLLYCAQKANFWMA